jgi:hypothetical protein
MLFSLPVIAPMVTFDTSTDELRNHGSQRPEETFGCGSEVGRAARDGLGPSLIAWP